MRTSTRVRALTKKEFIAALEDSLANADNDGAFSASKFFAQWFRTRGKAYVFLFRKNAKITNIQYAELRALISADVTRQNRHTRSLQFMAADEFQPALQKLVDAFPVEPVADLRYGRLAKRYHQLLRPIVVIEQYFSSCIVYLPPGVDICLPSICALSGYLHSAGPLVWVRRIDKCERNEFFAAVESYIQKHPADRRRFIAYSHEDFTVFDRQWAANLRDGLDGLKLHLDKMYMGEDYLSSLLVAMEARFHETLAVPTPGDYRKQTGLREAGNTIWLVSDYSLGENPQHRGENSYFICYEQHLANNNPFLVLGENKPAWIAHTTMPPSLIAAMINITVPHWPAGEVRIADPFVGTGTTWLELMKYQNVRAECSDLDAFAGTLAQDNLYVFGASPKELKSLLKVLAKELGLNQKELKLDRFPISPELLRDNAEIPAWVNDLFVSIGQKNLESGHNLDVSVQNKLLKLSFQDRLLFYVALRVYRRHGAAFVRNSRTVGEAYKKELLQIAVELTQLRSLRERRQVGPGPNGPLTVVEAKYSHACTVDATWLRGQLKKKTESILCRDVKDLPTNSYDVILADPPYGFNTKDSLEDLADLYSAMIRAMVKALRKNGQLVLCLPQISRTGRSIPFFTQRDIVIPQILTVVEHAGRHVIGLAAMDPAPVSMYRPPYYWESDRALRRTILHFRLS
jgi:hypothetical protein